MKRRKFMDTKSSCVHRRMHEAMEVNNYDFVMYEQNF